MRKRSQTRKLLMWDQESLKGFYVGEGEDQIHILQRTSDYFIIESRSREHRFNSSRTEFLIREIFLIGERRQPAESILKFKK